MSLDLSKYDYSNITAELEILTPEGEKTGAKLTLLHMDSMQFQKKNREVRALYMPKLEKLKIKGSGVDANVEMDGKLAAEMAQIQEEAGAQLLATVTIGWKGLKLGGGEYEYSHDNAIKLYTEYTWIKDQVDRFIADRKNFIKSSPKKS
jgi:hypothetical protein